MTMPRILAIGGSDSGGGAGIEADIKTITALGGYAMTAITAVTVQDTNSIAAITPIPAALVGRAITLVAADLGIDAIKIGMLGGAETIAVVTQTLATLQPRPPIVFDTVLASTSGTTLLEADAPAALLTHLMSLATLITPNRNEAASLAGIPIETVDDAIHAARLLCQRGAPAVLLKGGHFDGETLVDRLITPDQIVAFEHKRLASRHTHGTGCTLASAIAVGLARGLPLEHAITMAQDFLQKALRAAPGFGAGHGPMGHALVRQGQWPVEHP